MQTLQRDHGPGHAQGRSYISGGLTLSVLVMPIVIFITMEALRAVPNSIREAGLRGGATRWEVVRSHVLPYAAPGIFTGMILALARAFGETAPLLLVGAVTGFLSTPGGGAGRGRSRGSTPLSPRRSSRGPSCRGDDWRHITAAAIIVLLVVILVVNAAAIVLRNRYERKW